MNREQVDKYLERINYTMTGTETGAELIRNLHRNHCLHIPFENLDGCQGKFISLEKDKLFDKIVMHPRGGFCFEMNLLFADALHGLGFQGHTVQSRVFLVNNGDYGALNHCMNLFEADGKTWVCDVGFGRSGLVEPLELVMDQEQVSFGGQVYRIVPGTIMDYTVEVKAGEGFRPLLTFDKRPVPRLDFEISSYYCNFYPGFFFAEHIVITMPTEKGRISLNDDRLIIAEDGGVTDEVINMDDLEPVMDKYFGIRLEEKFRSKMW